MNPPTSRPIRWRLLELGIVLTAAVVLFLLRFGLAVLDPGQIDWLLARGDSAAYYLVWDTFRYEPWSFPLGRITQYLYPLGTSLPLADALPILAYPLRVVAPLLPENFQYYGFWHLVCCVLQAYFGLRIARRLVPDTASRILVALLFLLTPAYLYREGHIALSSHWVILAAIDLYLRGDQDDWRGRTLRWCALMAVVALIHPYLVAMVLVILAGLLLQPAPERPWPWRGRLATALAAGLTLLVVWYVAGNLEGSSADRMQAGGYTHFSLNLNSLVNPMGLGMLLDNLPLGRGQYEGFAFLGSGWLLIAVAGLVVLVVRRRFLGGWRQHRPLVILLVATFLYALSNIVRWGETTVLQYHPIPLLDLVTGVYRSSGRFVWPVLYAIMTALVFLAGQVRWRRPVAVFLLVALALQAWDLQHLILQRDRFVERQFATTLTDPNWQEAASRADGITTVPPFQLSLVQRLDYRDLCWLARQHRLPTTAGYAARMSPTARALADSMRTALAENTADPDQLYVCDRRTFPGVLADLDARFVGDVWNGYPVVHRRDWPLSLRTGYTATRGATLGEFLGERGDRVILLAACDEATYKLDPESRKVLEDLGFRVQDLAFRSSAAAIIDHGRVAWQQIDAEQRVSLELQPDQEVGGFRARRSLAVVSAGFEHGNVARLSLDGEEVGFSSRGFNLLVLDDEQRLVEVACFDTHAGRPGIVLHPQAAP